MTDFSQNFILKGLTKPNAQTERERERQRQRQRDPTKGTRRTTSARWMSSVWTKSLRPLLNNHTRPHVCLASNFNGFSLCEVYSDVDFPFVNVTCKTTHFSLREKKKEKKNGIECGEYQMGKSTLDFIAVWVEKTCRHLITAWLCSL